MANTKKTVVYNISRRPFLWGMGISGGFVSGLAGLLSFSGPNTAFYKLRNNTPSHALRNDLARLGYDMREVMEKERIREKTTS